PRHVYIGNYDYDEADNLLLLCSNHHTTIDEKVDSFPIEKIKQIKRDHERWVKNNLETTVNNVIEPTSEQNLLSFMVNQHDKIMNHKSLLQIQHSPESLTLAKIELEKISSKIKSFVQKLTSSPPNFKIIVRENEQKMVD